MKSSTIFILFNVVVGASFLFLFGLPFLVLGGASALEFWAGNWPPAVALAAVLAGIDGYFLANRRLFSLLEQENWPALTHYLEDRIVTRGRWSAALVRLLANTYLVLADAAAVGRLEAKLAAAKPRWLEREALVFGVARVLSGEGAAEFFAARLAARGGKAAKGAGAEWLDWYYAFALLLRRDFAAAADVLAPLSARAKDALVVGLSAFFLEDSLAKALPARAADLAAAAASARARLTAKLPSRAAWEKEVERGRASIHVVVLNKSLAEAGERFYA